MMFLKFMVLFIHMNDQYTLSPISTGPQVQFTHPFLSPDFTLTLSLVSTLAPKPSFHIDP